MISRIAFVGHPSSGKDTAAAYLVDRHGFAHVSTSDLLRFYIAEHALGEPTRERMRDVANVLRAEHGADYLARLVFQRSEERLIISGLRTPAEAAYSVEQGAHVVAISASFDLRYERALERERVGEQISKEEFKAREELEASNPNPESQNVNAVVAMATHQISNNGNLDELHAQLEALLAE